LLDVVHDQPDTIDRLLMCGHNPGLEDLILLLVPDTTKNQDESGLRDDVEDKFPTASIAEITFDIDRWADIASGKGKLTRFIRPRDLDAALGPDD